MMSQELGVLSVYDSGGSAESSFLGTVFGWLLLGPRFVILAIMGFALVWTSAVSRLAVLFAAWGPRSTLTWNTNVLGTTWRVGFSSLEEFIYRNWEGIDWGSELTLHKTGKHGGRRFPAGRWRIDFLARDAATNDLVVVHLKRGMASDSTVGQVLRKISWIKENVADKGQNVRGVIVARETDAALEYAVKDLPFLDVKTYSLDFRLSLGPTQVVAALTAPEHSEVQAKDESSGKSRQRISEALLSG